MSGDLDDALPPLTSRTHLFELRRRANEETASQGCQLSMAPALPTGRLDIIKNP